MDDPTDLDDVLFGAPDDEPDLFWKNADGWHFTYDGADVGPYRTKGEAEADHAGLARFDKYKDKPGFITTDTRKAN